MLLVIFVGVAGFFVLELPGWLVDRSLDSDAQGAKPLTAAQRTAAVASARQVVLLASGGVLAVITLALTQRRDAVARARHEIDRDANRTTRYTEAVKQLGDDKSAVRFGGVYALQRIGEDSQRDRTTIIQVLQAYIVETAPYSPYHRPPRPRGLLLWRASARAREAEYARQQALDAQALQAKTAKAAVEVVGRLSALDADRPRILLPRTYLWGADLEGAQLDRAVFIWAELTQANFDGAALHGAFLHDANLMMASFEKAQARGTHFVQVDATRADFTGADLKASSFEGAKCRSTIFAQANLRGASLVKANLEGASFDRANLQGADLSGVTTRGTSFVGADLRGVKCDGEVTDLGDTTDAKLGPLPARGQRASRLPSIFQR